jgi:hypothetical protein
MLPEDREELRGYLGGLQAGIETFELNWPTPHLSTFAVVTPNKVPDELQLSASRE